MDLLEILSVQGEDIKRETKIMKQKGVFGNLIESEAPVVVCDCVSYIRTNGLYNEGVFRVNGNGERVDEVKVSQTFTTSELIPIIRSGIPNITTERTPHYA